MKQIISHILLIATIITSCSEHRSIATDKENDNLQGKVKSVTTVEFYAIDKFNEGIICKGNPNSYGCEYIEYDSLGFYQKQVQYKLNFNQGKTIRVYDELHRKVREETYRNISDTGFSKCESYKYDGHNNVIETKDVYNDHIEKASFQYDKYGNLIWEKRKYDEIWYNYKDGKLISEKTINTVFDRPDISISKYEYDDKGNLIKQIYSHGQGMTAYDYTTYDQFNRRIDFYESSVENPSINQISHRVKWFYENDTVTKPNLAQYFGRDGTLYMVIEQFWFTNANDTTCILELRDNLISGIYDIQMDNNFKIETFYKVDSEIRNERLYHYNDNHQITAITDKYGTIEEYKYQNGEIYEKIHGYKDEAKTVYLYNKNLPKSSTSYNYCDSIINKSKYSYKTDGDSFIVTETTNYNSGKEVVTESLYKGSRIIKTVVRSQGDELDRCEYTYNDKKDIIRIEETTNGKKEDNRFTYEYDARGNWTRKISYCNDKINNIIERSISYYK